jgi:ADP-ribosylglycohydrolase
LSITEVWQAYERLHQIKFKCAPAIRPEYDVDGQIVFAPELLLPIGSHDLKTFAPLDGDQLVDVVGLDRVNLDNVLVNKILGVIFGNALGDAVGLSTEFMTKSQVARILTGSGILDMPYPCPILNKHSTRWAPGDWTDDTDQMLLIMETLTETKCADKVLFARKLKAWVKEGFPELGDKSGMGLGATTAKVVSHPAFLSDPFVAAKSVYATSGSAANGAVMRTSVVGCFTHGDEPAVINNALLFAKTTHFHPLCGASAAAVSLLVARMLQGRPHGRDSISLSQHINVLNSRQTIAFVLCIIS